MNFVIYKLLFTNVTWFPLLGNLNFPNATWFPLISLYLWDKKATAEGWTGKHWQASQCRCLLCSHLSLYFLLPAHPFYFQHLQSPFLCTSRALYSGCLSGSTYQYIASSQAQLLCTIIVTIIIIKIIIIIIIILIIIFLPIFILYYSNNILWIFYCITLY